MKAMLWEKGKTKSGLPFFVLGNDFIIITSYDEKRNKFTFNAGSKLGDFSTVTQAMVACENKKPELKKYW
jgi:hypothetical protein